MKTQPRKTCPEGFEVTVGMRVWAAKQVPGVDIDFETAAMMDHDFRTAHSDWLRVWRNWMRESYRKLTRYQPKKVVVEIVADAEMEKLKNLRAAWSIPNFRDPFPGESVSDYRRAMDCASTEARAPKLKLVKV